MPLMRKPKPRARIAVTHAQLGDLYLVANHPERAIEHYRAALEVRPRFMDIRSKYAEALIELGELHEATPWQKSDLTHALAVGAYLGLLGGLMLGLYLQAVPIGEHHFGLGTVLLATLGGGAFGAWSASLVGVSTPNWKLKGFDREFAAGKILLMLDIEPARAAEIHELLACRHPEAVERHAVTSLPALP